MFSTMTKAIHVDAHFSFWILGQTLRGGALGLSPSNWLRGLRKHHNILLDRLYYKSFGIWGQVLDWIHSFVSGRLSNRSSILCGVPQGSVLGPLLFILYATDVIPLAQRHGFQVHSYADDTQLYFHDKAASCERRLSRFSECISSETLNLAQLNSTQPCTQAHSSCCVVMWV